MTSRTAQSECESLYPLEPPPYARTAGPLLLHGAHVTSLIATARGPAQLDRRALIMLRASITPAPPPFVDGRVTA